MKIFFKLIKKYFKIRPNYLLNGFCFYAQNNGKIERVRSKYVNCELKIRKNFAPGVAKLRIFISFAGETTKFYKLRWRNHEFLSISLAKQRVIIIRSSNL